MLAYKVFSKRDGELYPAIMVASLGPYELGFIITRPYNCGPFACFKKLKDARGFSNLWRDTIIRRVRITKSRDKTLWFKSPVYIGRISENNLPDGTILADEFEILEEVK